MFKNIVVLMVIVFFQINMLGNDFSTYTIEPKDVPVMYYATGTVESRTETDISPRITSRIMEIFVRSGDRVKKDQTLIKLEDNELRATVMEVQDRIESISAGIRASKQAVETAKAEVELATAEKERSDRLYEKRAVSKKQNEETNTAYKKAVAELNRANRNVEVLTSEKSAAEQSLERSKTLLAFSVIKSPIDGVVGERNVDPGDLAVPGKILMKVFDPGRLMLEIPVRESLIKEIKLGEKIEFNVEALNKKYFGEVKEIVPYVDIKTRTFLVKVCIDKSEGLIPGMYGVADIIIGAKQELLVPANAITRIGQIETVFVKENGKQKKLFVRTIQSAIPNMRTILSGLKKGDQVILQ